MLFKTKTQLVCLTGLTSKQRIGLALLYRHNRRHKGVSRNVARYNTLTLAVCHCDADVIPLRSRFASLDERIAD